ncbi:hypothetical protein C9374_005543 [Naegleria lovaniensis]|uniref:Palmitoyltransferase n=1 Tax=Naegleria lovaniensis TaxID=51637 RepID=A0AA88KN99_NAELO|nr:uncharacterized protein C9374_005543 [Naegleria lovaniensis]KAG2382341.1 hypothetical protein C9374_005543 [Naegleria lovaniensis]
MLHHSSKQSDSATTDSSPVILIGNNDHHHHQHHHHGNGRTNDIEMIEMNRQYNTSTTNDHSHNNNNNDNHHHNIVQITTNCDGHDQIDYDSVDEELKGNSDDPTNNIIANTTLTLYQAWIGNNTLCCKGRVIIGPDRKLFILTLILMFIPAIIYAPVIMPHYLLFVHPAAGVILLIVPLIGFLLMLIGLFYTSFTDPGIIPRRKYIDQQFAQTGEEKTDDRKPEPPQFQKVHLENGQIVELKYCPSCEIYRPPRTSHCRRCNNCVERFDHHCPWTGTCIGRRNYRSFILFIFSTTITSWLVIFICIAHTVLVWIYYFNINTDTIQDKVSNSIRYSVGGLVLIVYIFLTQLFVGSLSVFHSYLISTGQTTYEYVNKAKKMYNRGLFRNWFFTLCVITECRRSKMMMRHTLPIPKHVTEELNN